MEVLVIFINGIKSKHAESVNTSKTTGKIVRNICDIFKSLVSLVQLCK